MGYPVLQKFRVGLHNYLEARMYGNSVTDDLWTALEAASGEHIVDMMHTMTKQMGYPVLQAEQVINDHNRVLTIIQTKFNLNGSKKDDDLWIIPITVSTSSSSTVPVFKTILSDTKTTITVNNIKKTEWLKLNVGSIGFYRTLYSNEMLIALKPAIPSMSVADRLGLENDMFALARAGIVYNSKDFLVFALNFKMDTDYTIWVDLCSNLSTLSVLIQNTNYSLLYDEFQVRFLKDIVDRLGWDPKTTNEDPTTAMLRGLVIGQTGEAGSQDIIKEAQKRFDAYINHGAPLNPDLRNAVYSIVVQYGGQAAYDQMLRLLHVNPAPPQEEKMRILLALGRATLPELITRTLNMAMTETEVRKQDGVAVINGVTGSLAGRNMAWKFVRDNWTTKIINYFTGHNLLTTLITGTTAKLATPKLAQEVKAFFDNNPRPGTERTVQQSIELIGINAAQLKRDGKIIKQYLSSVPPSGEDEQKVA